MSKNYLDPNETYEFTVEKGVAKANASMKFMLSLGFLGGAFIGLAVLAAVRIGGLMPASFGGAAGLIGAMVFPIGLICILICGGELLTGNMMAVTTAVFAGKVSPAKLAKNLVVITFANLVGALFVAYFLGHLGGFMEGEIAARTIKMSEHKIHGTFFQGILSGIGCNWLVGIGVWFNYAAKDVAGKWIGIWLPLMTFFAVGFQHIVANMFLIPAGMMAGANITLMDFIKNMCTIFIGNYLGAILLIALPYTMAFKKK